MKKVLAVILALLLLLSAAGCAAAPGGSKNETVTFTDSCGREVTLPKTITKIAPSGGVATMLMAILAPEAMVCVAETPDANQLQYLPAQLATLPATGQLYGGKSTINLEELLKAAPQVIIDLGDKKGDMTADLDALQEQTGIPVIFLEADLDSMAAAFRSLGTLLGKTERAEALASFIDETLAMAAANSAAIPEGERVSVMHTSGASGLNTNAAGSIHATVLDVVGAVNAVVVEDVSGKAGGNPIDMEQLYNFDPQCIIMTSDAPYDDLAAADGPWAELSAVKNDAYYQIPALPYNWMGVPPSINMVLGIWWLGNLLYPNVYDYDMTAKAQDIFKLFWDYDLTADEAQAMLERSAAKRAGA